MKYGGGACPAPVAVCHFKMYKPHLQKCSAHVVDPIWRCSECVPISLLLRILHRSQL